MTDPNRKEGNWAVREKYQQQNRRFVTIDTRLLNDERVRRLSENGERVFLHLLIHPGTVSIPGLLLASEAQMAERMRWPIHQFRNAFAELVREEIAEADWDAGLVWLRKAFKHRWPTGPKVVQSWKRIILHTLPECDLLRRALAAIFDGLQTVYENSKGFVEAFGNTVPIRYRIPYREGFQEPYAKQEGSKIVDQDSSSSAPAHARDDQQPHPQSHDEGVGDSLVEEYPIPTTPTQDNVEAQEEESPFPQEPTEDTHGSVDSSETTRTRPVAGRSEANAPNLDNVIPIRDAPSHGPRERLWARLQVQREEETGWIPESIDRVIDKDGVDTLEEMRALYEDDAIVEMHLPYLRTEKLTVKGRTIVLARAKPGWPWDLFKNNADRYYTPKGHAPPIAAEMPLGEVRNAF